jgi:thiamine pyrophosphate-dependent acetolactate synthase large subunit-like protein
MIPTLVRDSFRVVEERPGPVHLELPEDIAHATCEPVPMVPPHSVELPLANAEALDHAAEMILQAERPSPLSWRLPWRRRSPAAASISSSSRSTNRKTSGCWLTNWRSGCR